MENGDESETKYPTRLSDRNQTEMSSISTTLEQLLQGLQLLEELQLDNNNNNGGDLEFDHDKKITHYTSKLKILLVGEGDFSFAACLAKAFGDASNMVATSLDSLDELRKKYAKANSSLEVLKEKGCTVVHEVDVLTMANHPALRNQLFDRIVYNFPHNGLLPAYREHEPYLIELHRGLVRGFFKSAYKLVEKSGEIHVTHKTAHPFDRWHIEDLADETGLKLVGKAGFYLCQYPGYCNRKGEGHGTRCDEPFNVGECSTFKFGKRLWL